MFTTRKLVPFAGAVALIVAACAPAAPTAAPTSTVAPAAAPTSTVAPAAPPSSGVRPVPTATAATEPGPTPSLPKYGGTLTYVLRTDPAVWDMMKTSGGYADTRVQWGVVFSPLFTMEPKELKTCTLAINPDLVDKWQWRDDLTFEFSIHSGVKFHNKPPVNGRELTSEDVVFSLKRGLFEWPLRRIAPVAQAVKEVVPVDRYAVRISNSRPNPPLLSDIALANGYGMNMLARESVGKDGSWEDPAKTWIGTGPFMFQSYVPGIKVSHKRHPEYWEKGLPYMDGMEFLVMPEASTREAAMRAGKLDLWPQELPFTSADALRRTAPRIKLEMCPGGSFGVLYLRFDRPPSPTSGCVGPSPWLWIRM